MPTGSFIIIAAKDKNLIPLQKGILMQKNEWSLKSKCKISHRSRSSRLRFDGRMPSKRPPEARTAECGLVARDARRDDADFIETSAK